MVAHVTKLLNTLQNVDLLLFRYEKTKQEILTGKMVEKVYYRFHFSQLSQLLKFFKKKLRLNGIRKLALTLFKLQRKECLAIKF